jgi:quercetin dioxygenase-like cupin family protein
MTHTSHAFDPRPRLGHDALSAIAEGIASADPGALLPVGDVRRWALAARTEVYEAWVIAWPAGTGLAMHDHDGSTAAVSVVNGRLRERSVEADGAVHLRWLRPGPAVVLPHDHVHEVVNVDEAEVVSVQVYSPPMADLSFRRDPELDLDAARVGVLVALDV